MRKLMRAPVRVALATGLLLMVPLIAMQLTDDMAWTPFDFAFIGILLFGTGLAYELIAGRTGSVAYRAAVGLALATALFLFVAMGAVGIIGSEDNPANLMYFGVLAVGVIGACIARLEPNGMARALFAAALAQGLVAVIALIAYVVSPSMWGESTGMPGPSPVVQILGGNGMFIVLFLASARLFLTAASGQTPAGSEPER